MKEKTVHYLFDLSNRNFNNDFLQTIILKNSLVDKLRILKESELGFSEYEIKILTRQHYDCQNILIYKKVVYDIFLHLISFTENLVRENPYILSRYINVILPNDSEFLWYFQKLVTSHDYHSYKKDFIFYLAKEDCIIEL